MCEKCRRKAEEVHQVIIADEKPHTFQIEEGYEDEYENPAPIPTRSNSVASRKGLGLADDAPGDGEETSELIESEEDNDMLDFQDSEFWAAMDFASRYMREDT